MHPILYFLSCASARSVKKKHNEKRNKLWDILNMQPEFYAKLLNAEDRCVMHFLNECLFLLPSAKAILNASELIVGIAGKVQVV